MDDEVKMIGSIDSSMFRYELWSDRSWKITFAGMRNKELERVFAECYSGDLWWTGSGKPADRILADVVAHLKYFDIGVRKVEVF